MTAVRDFAVVTDVERIGSVPCCVALEACDVGKVTYSDGSWLYITWGRNLTREQVGWYERNTAFSGFKLIGIESWELVLPFWMVEKLLPVLGV